MSSLKDFLYKQVRVISTDARMFEGKLEGFDNSTNIVISNCIERIVANETDGEYQELNLGVYMMRGGNIVCVGEVDGTISIEWSKVTGDKLKGTKNPL